MNKIIEIIKTFIKFQKKNKKIKKIILILINIFSIFNIFIKKFIHKKAVGIIGLEHSQNIGNNLLKYAIYTKVSELGFIPYIVGKRFNKQNISFVLSKTKVRLINKTFDEIKKNDYDILMVNSDQTWRKWNKNKKDFYDIAFLRFAKNWNIPKFTYGASLGLDKWQFNKKDEKIAKYLLKNFNGISVREKGSIKFIKKYLGFKSEFVLDPTFLIDKKYYLNLIKKYISNINIDNNYIFVYLVAKKEAVINYINNIKEKYNYNIININMYEENSIEKFIYGISKCKGIITDSYHGTIFSIIFNKPFISFACTGKERFNSLNEIFKLNNRIYEINSNPSINLLETPLNLDKTLFNTLKIKSLKYLEKHLKLNNF